MTIQGRFTRFSMGATVLLSLSGLVPVEAQEAEFEWSGAMTAGRTLEVRGITGNIRAELSPGSAASVTAVKRGRTADFDDVEIRVVEHGDGVTVCAVYGARNRDREGCDGDSGDRRGHEGGHRGRIDVDLDFAVRVPQGVELIASMVTGDVEVEGVRSDVEATSVSGDVFVSTTGVARATTVSGSIDVAMGSADWEDLEFRTVSGDVTLRLPAGVATEVDFKSLSGDLDSDFEIEGRRSDRRRGVGTSVRGSIGDGGRTLTVRTVSGDLRLRRGG